MRSLATTLLLLLLALPLGAETRKYAGGFSSRWATVGPHGHDQPLCAEPKITYAPGVIAIEGPNCNVSDFARANLDNSIGFRAGIEKDFLSSRFLELVGGAETSVSFTEYNITQMELALLSGAATAGADITIAGLRAGVRYGAGGYSTLDGMTGLQDYRELVASIPLREGARLRISQRRVNYRHRLGGHWEVQKLNQTGNDVRGMETSVLLEGNGPAGDSPWEFSTATGLSEPGSGGPGGSLGLRATPYHRLAIFRDTKWGVQAYGTWTATAHESKHAGMYKGFPNNFRSKTIDAFGVGVRRKRNVNTHLSVHYGGGIEVADWRDDYGLLIRNSGTQVIGGVEGALSANASLRMNLGRGTGIELQTEQLYWTGIRLGELRWGIGLVLTR